MNKSVAVTSVEREWLLMKLAPRYAPLSFPMATFNHHHHQVVQEPSLRYTNGAFTQNVKLHHIYIQSVCFIIM